jgi:hypothetical protein
MASLVLRIASLCTLLHTVSPSGWNSDLQVQESRNYLSDARVKSIQNNLLLHDTYAPSTRHNPQSNMPSHDYRPRQDESTPTYRPQNPRTDSSKYRPHQTQGYETYEEPDEPSTNLQQSSFQVHSSGSTRLSDSTVSKGNMNYQKNKSTVHQIYHRKPIGLLENTHDVSVIEGSSNYPYIIVRPQGDMRNHRIKPSAPGGTLVYQTAPTESQGNSGVLPNSHVSLGQYVETVPVLTRVQTPQGTQIRVNPFAALLLASSLNSMPIIGT